MLRFAMVLALLPSTALACGSETDCVLGDRLYRIHIGPTTAPEMGAIVFAHGYRGSAAGVMRNGSLKALADELGVALIALDAKEDDWKLDDAPRETPGGQDGELAYVAAVLDDAETRFGIDRDKLIATGFSAGGMMTWTLACYASDHFAGFAPMSGTFWGDIPGSCPTAPASVVHIHGDDDGTVPLMGRPIGNTRQGEVPTALSMYADYGRFGPETPYTALDMDCTRRTNDAAQILDFCLFEGGHSFSTARLRYAFEILMEAAAP